MKQHFFYALIFLLMGQIVYAKKINLITGNNFKPFADQSLPKGGLSTDIIKRTFSKMGNEVNIEFFPWKRGYKLTMENKYFATFPYSRNKDREKVFHFSDKIIEFEFRFFVNKDSRIKYSKDSDLNGLVVCIPLGYNQNPLKSFFERKILTLVNPKGIDACLKMLESKRVNIVFANEYAGWGSIKELYGKKGLSKFKTLDKAIQKNAMYMIVSKTYPNGKKILEKFNEALGQLKKEKVIQGILDDYLK